MDVCVCVWVVTTAMGRHHHHRTTLYLKNITQNQQLNKTHTLKYPQFYVLVLVGQQWFVWVCFEKYIYMSLSILSMYTQSGHYWRICGQAAHTNPPSKFVLSVLQWPLTWTLHFTLFLLPVIEFWDEFTVFPGGAFSQHGEVIAGTLVGRSGHQAVMACV